MELPLAPRTGFAAFLRAERTGGLLLLGATIVALAWANLAADSYADFWALRGAIGPESLHLDLTLAHWATDGLLAIFFLVAGIEVRRELTAGELHPWRRALLPLAAAVGGMVMPALVAIVVSGGAAARDGIWAIPIATDIAFALGVLALVATRLPIGVRILLLSLAVLDDLVAIALIAILFTSSIEFAWLAGAALACAAWAALTRVGDETSTGPTGGAAVRLAWMAALATCAAAAWTCLHASGVHATVSGVLLGLLAPTRAGAHLQRILHPLSAGLCVPVFALAAAGIPLDALGSIGGERLAVAVVAGLVVGKPLGIALGTWLAMRMTGAPLPERVTFRHVWALGLLGGIGYTVSLLMVQLTTDAAALRETLSAAVLVASAASALLAVALLRARART